MGAVRVRNGAERGDALRARNAEAVREVEDNGETKSGANRSGAMAARNALRWEETATFLTETDGS